jgi:hypothetical protein
METPVTASGRPRVADPTFHLEDERTRAYREASARLRDQSKVASLNGKPASPATAAASN